MSLVPSRLCNSCGGKVSDQAKFCGNCGALVPAPKRPAGPTPLQGNVISGPISPAQPSPPPRANIQNVHVQPGAPPPAQNINVYVTQPGHYGPQQEDATFAVITLICYLLLWPVGAFLNLIGLITGPRRGCFLAMFLLILVPGVLLSIALVLLIASGAMEEIIRELERI